MRFSVRDLVYIGVFGALWGTMEITSGSILHVFNIPFAGAILSGVGIAIALIGRLFVPRPGSIVFIGLVTAFLKMFSLGGIIIYPVIGIIAESILAELAVKAPDECALLLDHASYLFDIHSHFRRYLPML